MVHQVSRARDIASTAGRLCNTPNSQANKRKGLQSSHISSACNSKFMLLALQGESHKYNLYRVKVTSSCARASCCAYISMVLGQNCHRSRIKSRMITTKNKAMQVRTNYIFVIWYIHETRNVVNVRFQCSNNNVP